MWVIVFDDPLTTYSYMVLPKNLLSETSHDQPKHYNACTITFGGHMIHEVYHNHPRFPLSTCHVQINFVK